jgi:hypothetical protein
MSTHPPHEVSDDASAFGYQPRIVVKFRDGIGLPYETSADGGDLVGEHLVRRHIAPWELFAERYPDVELEPLFGTVSTDELDEFVRIARRRTPTYSPPDFRSYFVTRVPWAHDPEEVVEVISGWTAVETAYVQLPMSLPSVDPDDDPMYPAQGHLDPAPASIDAEFVWPREASNGTLVSGFRGGDGAGRHVVDVEAGWTLDHQDLPPAWRCWMARSTTRRALTARPSSV